ncbi:MAG: hypothetical protein JJE25_14335 [Bacteroidia bacterium]|nr:hypothetical protein [Bacteroidia bacterium]
MKSFTLLFLLFSQFLFAQSEKKKILPTAGAGIQFAGSIGWLSAGYFRQSANKKIELGFLYGYTPVFAGGNIHTIALKFIYEPFRINVKPDIQIEPIQAGVFFTQNFAKNLYISMPEKYKAGYYKWISSLRIHVFLGLQVSYILNDKVVQKISFHFEANTNDLYYRSYTVHNNRNSLDLSEIIFFGIGSKVYFQ